MAHSEARAWWADVQHLRDGYEFTDEARRRADEEALATRRAIRERRHVEAEVSSVTATPRFAPDASTAPRRVSGTAGVTRRAPEPVLAPRRGQHDRAVGHDIVLSAEPPRGPNVKGAPKPGRRTIEIRGQAVPAPTVPRTLDPERRRPSRRAVERVGSRPDRVAMWALMMGLLLILVALGTADTPAFIALSLH